MLEPVRKGHDRGAQPTACCGFPCRGGRARVGRAGRARSGRGEGPIEDRRGGRPRDAGGGRGDQGGGLGDRGGPARRGQGAGRDRPDRGRPLLAQGPLRRPNPGRIRLARPVRGQGDGPRRTGRHLQLPGDGPGRREQPSSEGTMDARSRKTVSSKVLAILPLPESFSPLLELASPWAAAYVAVDNPGHPRIGPGERSGALLPEAHVATIPTQAMHASASAKGSSRSRFSELRSRVPVRALGATGPERVQVSGPFRLNDLLIVDSSVPLAPGTFLRFDTGDGLAHPVEGTAHAANEGGSVANITPPPNPRVAPIGSAGAPPPKAAPPTYTAPAEPPGRPPGRRRGRGRCRSKGEAGAWAACRFGSQRKAQTGAPPPAPPGEAFPSIYSRSPSATSSSTRTPFHPRRACGSSTILQAAGSRGLRPRADPRVAGEGEVEIAREWPGRSRNRSR